MGAKGSCLSETIDVVISASENNQTQSVHPTTSNTLDLMAVDPKTVDDIPCKNKEIKARVYDVYDGDSCSVIFDAGGYLYKTKIRIIGIDCPEMNPKSKDPNYTLELKELEKAAAIKCRDFVRSCILNDLVTIKMHEHDKYGGRVLAEIFIEHNYGIVSLSDVMVSGGYARKYQGEEKIPWTKKELTTPPFG